MSIKDLFKNKTKNQVTNESTLSSASVDVESYELVKAKTYKKDEFVPPIDYATASNFAKYGSAELYYEYAFKRVYEEYPYDGTLAEKIEFENSSSYLDKYILEEIYPRTNGYIIMGYQGLDGANVAEFNDATTKEYIKFYGGPHTASGGMVGKTFDSTFDDSTLYDPTNGRESNLKIDFTKGATIEFWLKKDAWDSGTYASKEVVFDLWNQVAEGSSDYGRLLLWIDKNSGTNHFKLGYASGSGVSVEQTINSTLSIDDGNWHHYAISLKNDGTNMNCNFYVDGVFNKRTINSTLASTIAGTSNGLMATLGSFATGSSLPHSDALPLQLGDGKLSASMDEFRFWKTERDAKQIGYNWFTQVGGGTDDHTYNTDLGVYYKFNEGITTTAATDATVLDYSGRLSNGQWTGYTSGARSTGSAIVLAGAAEKEFKDPIIYSHHPTVSGKEAEYKLSGSEIDYNNPSLFHHLLPSWLIEDDQENGQNIRYLSQIMASYFDTLHSQVEYVNKIKDENYSGALLVTGTVSPDSVLHLSGGTKPLPFARNLLRGRGFVVPNLFVEANIVEEFLDQDNNEVYEKDIAEVKNKIYQNIYNNLLYIYKSKGTEKAFRNLFRAFGVDSNLIKLNMYADGATYTIKDNYEFRSVPTRMVNFNHPSNFEALVYASSGSLSDETREAIPDQSDAEFSAFTAECEVVFPKKLQRGETGYFGTAFVTSSLFGFHRVDTDNHTFHADDNTVQVYIVRDEVESPNAYFLVTGSNSIELTSSRFTNLYDNNKWNLALRYKHSKYPQSTHITGGMSGDYDLEFYAVNSNGATILNEFELTTSVSTSNPEYLLTKNKKFYVGASRTNFTGAIAQRSDVKVSHLRYWQSYLSNAVIKQHSYDVENYGPDSPYDSDAPLIIDNTHVPKFETLALNWDFAVATGSDASGQFYVPDASSGSGETRYGWMSEIIEKKHPGLGYGFVASSTKAIDKEYVFSAQSKDPHNTFNSDMITIKGANADEVFFEDDEVSDNFYSLEKSMQSVITDEMVKMFGSIIDFNNVVGDPVNQYRSEYKELNHLRRLFFERVENEPDQEKFFEFYKWIDTSISYAVRQLFPASTRFSDGVANVIQSHVLEKNKYQHKFPLIAQETSTEGSIRGRAEAGYNWELGHAPLPASPGEAPVENKNLLWQKTRREHSSLPGSDSSVLEATEVLRSIANRKSAAQVKHVKVLKSTTAGAYLSTYPIESSVFQTDWKLKRTIHGGINYPPNKNRDYVHDTTRPGGPVDGTNLPINYLSIGLGVGTGILPPTANNDEQHPLYKKRINIVSFAHPYYDQPGTYEQKLKGHYSVPFNAYTSSLAPNSGYLKRIHDNWSDQIIVANLHSDTTDFTNEIPMQGPFTETHVGGHQSRHVPVNKYDTKLNSFGDARTNNIDDFASRPEAWQIAMGSSPWSDPDGVLAFIGADYGSPYPQPNYQLATRYRNVKTKRPVNLQNIQHNTGSGRMGNYNRNYEVLSGFGRAPFARAARRNSAAVMTPPPFLSTAAYYTNPVSLVASKASTSGNTLSAHEQSNIFHDHTSGFPSSPGNTTKSIIGSIFSAPGGPETKTDIFLDKTSKQYSVYNALPFRNIRVRSSGSGEADSMWAVQSHTNRREGLQTHLRRHSGKFGIDSVHGAVTSQNYSSEPNFQKQHRNTSYNMTQPAGNVTTVVQAEVAGRAASGSFWVSGAIFDGTFTSGAFEMTGRHIAGSGSRASFDIAAITDGDYATGSFNVSGSTVNSVSSGSFVVTGAFVAGAYATASFTVTGATIYNPAIASFDVTSAFGPGVFSSGSFNVTGAHVQAASASASFIMQSVPDPGARLYSIFDVSANVYDRDYIELEGKTFEVETGNPYGDADEDGDANTIALQRLTWEKGLYLDGVQLSSSADSNTSRWFLSQSNLELWEQPRNYMFATQMKFNSSELAGSNLKIPIFTAYLDGTTNTALAGTETHDTASLEIYFAPSQSASTPSDSLWIDRYWWDENAKTYQSRSVCFEGFGSRMSDDGENNPEGWKTMVLAQSGAEVQAWLGKTTDITLHHYAGAGFPGGPVTRSTYGSWPATTIHGDFLLPANKVMIGSTISASFDETALWDDGVYSSGVSSHKDDLTTDIWNQGDSVYNEWSGGGSSGIAGSSSAMKIYYRFGDEGTDNTTNNGSTLQVTNIGNGTLGTLQESSGWNTTEFVSKKSRYYQTKTPYAWFEHVKDTINSNLPNVSVDYRQAMINTYADFTGPWYVTGGISSPAKIHSGDTIYFGRFALTRSTIAADTVSINVQNGLSGSPAQTSSFLAVESGNGEASGDLGSTIAHADDFAFASAYRAYIDHYNKPTPDPGYELITTYNNTSSAIGWGSTGTGVTRLENTSYPGNDLWNSLVDSFSISFWLNPHVNDVTGTILNMRESSNEAIWIAREGTDLIFRIYEYGGPPSGKSQKWYATDVLTSSTWQHIAFSFTGGLGTSAAAPTSINKLWINGQLSNELSVEADDGFGGSPTFLGWKPSSIGVGDSLSALTTDELQGSLQDLCLWTGSLNNSDAEELYNYGRTKNILSHQNVYNLMHWWKLGSDGAPSGYSPGDNLTASFAFVDYGFVSNIPHGDMGSSRTTPLTTKAHTVNFITGGIPTDSKSDSVFWGDFVSSFNANVTTNFTASRSSNTITLNTTTMGTSLNGIVLAENGGTFTLNNALTVGGVDPEGATFGHSIEIGTKKFELTQSGGSLLDGTAIGVLAGPTSDGITNNNFWDNLKTHIENQGEFVVNTSSVSANLMQFSLTASETGSSWNSRINNASSSFPTVVNTAGGLGFSGSYQSASIDIADGVGGVTRFILFTGSTNPYATPGHVGVSNTGSNAQFWQKLTESIATHTDFDIFSSIVSGDSITISMTASTTASANNQTLVAIPAGGVNVFSNLYGATNGGTYKGGAADDDRITLGGPTVRTLFAKINPTHGYMVKCGPSSSTLSNTTWWNDLRTAINARTSTTKWNCSGFIDNGDSTATFHLTATVTGSVMNNFISQQYDSPTFIAPKSYSQYGTDFSGSFHGDSIDIDGKSFILYSGVSDPYTGGSVYGISNTGSNEEFWLRLTASIKANTDFTTINTNSAGGGSLMVHLTGLSMDDSHNIAMAETGNSFSSLIGTAGGGTYIAGVQHSHSITYNSQKFIFYTGSSVPAGWPATAIQSTGSGVTRASRDTDFWTRFSQSISSSTVFSTVTVVEDPADNEAFFHFTASTAGTSPNGGGTLEPLGNPSFQSATPAGGGAAVGGVPDEFKFEADGVSFEVDRVGDGLSDITRVHVTGTQGTTQAFWDHLEQVIVSNTSFDFVSWFTGSTPPSSASFQLSSSVSGANRAAFFHDGGGVMTNVVHPYGATYMSGANHGDTITFAGKTFELLTGSVPSDPSYIRINGIQTSDLALWQAMSRSIEVNTDLSCSGITLHSDGKAHLHLTATVATTSLNGGFSFSAGNQTFHDTPTASPLAGGQDPSGSTPGDWIRIDGVRFQIVTGSEPVPAGAIKVKFSGSPSVYTDDYVWTKLEHQIEAHTTNYDASRISYVAHGNKALFSFTASSEIATGYGLSANPSSQTFWDLNFLDGATHIPEITNTSYQEASYSVGYDNAYVNTPIPRSDFQYSWIRNTVGTGRESQSDYPQQVLHGYAPYDGIVSASSGLQEAIVFPARTTDVECLDAFMPIYGNQHGLYTQTYECGADDPINWGGLLTFTHPYGIDPGYPVYTIYDSGGSPVSAPSGTGSFYVDYTASYGSAAGTIERRVTVIVQDTVPPIPTVLPRTLWGDAVYTPQTNAPMNDASGWWSSVTNPWPATNADPHDLPGNFGRLSVSEACGTVTWTSGGFGAVVSTGSGYVPGTYAISFTASDSNGLTSSPEVSSLIVELKTPFTASHFIHAGGSPSWGNPTPFPSGYAPFSDFGPEWKVRTTSSPLLTIYADPSDPALNQFGVELDFENFEDGTGLYKDSNGHAWYPIPSASWWDPAADVSPSSAPATKKTGGIDQELFDDGYVPMTDPLGTHTWTPHTLPSGPLPGYLLFGIAGTWGDAAVDARLPTTASMTARNGDIVWTVDLRGSIYGLTASYRIV